MSWGRCRQRAERREGSSSSGAAPEQRDAGRRRHHVGAPHGALQVSGTSWDPAPHLNNFWCQPGDAGSPDGEDRPLEKDQEVNTSGHVHAVGPRLWIRHLPVLESCVVSVPPSA